MSQEKVSTHGGWLKPAAMIKSAVLLALVLVAALLGVAPSANAGQLPGGTPKLDTTTRAASTNTVTFYWGLKTRESAARKQLRRVSDPRRTGYRKFQTAKTIAREYGATRSTVRTVAKYAKSKGLKPTLDKSRLLMRVRGTVSAFEKGFKMKIFSGPISESGTNYYLYLTLKDPKLPARITRLVPNPVWISARQIPGSGTRASTARTDRLKKIPTNRASYPTNQGTLIQACTTVRKSPYVKLMMSIGQLAKAYKFSHLRIPRTRGEVNSRPLIGVLAAGFGFSNATLAQAKRCFGASAQPKRVRTGGLIGRLPPGDEGTLDPQIVATSLLGNTRFPVYESPALGVNQYFGALTALNSSQRPHVLTTSYGTCEALLKAPMRRIADTIFLRLGLAGTSVLAAAGDRGSSACVNNDTGTGPTGRAVWYPASSPYVTAVGGTRVVLNRNNSIRREVAWNDTAFGVSYGGGGGNSKIYRRQWWQPARGTGGKTARRAVPDISAHADGEFPGYAVFMGNLASLPVIPTGGTSAATPLTASAIALMVRREQAKGRPALGFLNPWLYQVGGRAIRDVVSGTNDLYGNGCCNTRRGYDRATGLGSPNFHKLQRSIRPAR